jgi:hypothetical protein
LSSSLSGVAPPAAGGGSGALLLGAPFSPPRAHPSSSFALWLDANLEWGFSGPCETFGTVDSLVAVAPGGGGGSGGSAAGSTPLGTDGGRFRVVRVEAWGFTLPSANGARALRQQQAANAQLHVQGVSALPRTASSAALASAGVAGGTRASEERRWA